MAQVAYVYAVCGRRHAVSCGGEPSWGPEERAGALRHFVRSPQARQNVPRKTCPPCTSLRKGREGRAGWASLLNQVISFSLQLYSTTTISLIFYRVVVVSIFPYQCSSESSPRRDALRPKFSVANGISYFICVKMIRAIFIFPRITSVDDFSINAVDSHSHCRI